MFVVFVGYCHPRMYVPTNYWQYNELFCIVMQQTSYPQINAISIQQNFENPRTLVPTNRNDSRACYLKWIDWLINCLSTQLNYFIHIETSQSPVQGHKNHVYAWCILFLRRKGSLSCYTCCETGPWFSRSHLRDCPMGRFLQSKGFLRPSILARIPPRRKSKPLASC